MQFWLLIFDLDFFDFFFFLAVLLLSPTSLGPVAGRDANTSSPEIARGQLKVKC